MTGERGRGGEGGRGGGREGEGGGGGEGKNVYLPLEIYIRILVLTCNSCFKEFSSNCQNSWKQLLRRLNTVSQDDC